MTFSTEAKLTALTLLKTLNTIGILILIALTFQVLHKIAAQAQINHDDTQASTNRIEADLNCLGRFFSQTNRQNLKIDDLYTCRIINTETGETNILAAPPPSVTTSPSGRETPTNGQANTATPINTTPQTQTSASTPHTTTSAPPDPGTAPTGIAPVDNLLKKVGL